MDNRGVLFVKEVVNFVFSSVSNVRCFFADCVFYFTGLVADRIFYVAYFFSGGFFYILDCRVYAVASDSCCVFCFIEGVFTC